MARVTTYLNFANSTEQAFNFYKTVFGTEFKAPIVRFRDMPPPPGQPPMGDDVASLVMHVELPILGGHVIMGTDAPEGMGFKLTAGNNIWINLEPDSKADTDRLFRALAEGGKVEMALADMPWGGYFGTLEDRFGMRWMFNCTAKS